MNDPERIHIFFVKHIVHTIELFGRVTGPAENFSALEQSTINLIHILQP